MLFYYTVQPFSYNKEHDLAYKLCRLSVDVDASIVAYGLPLVNDYYDQIHVAPILPILVSKKPLTTGKRGDKKLDFYFGILILL